MPAFDRYHALVVRVLAAAGWTIVGEQVLLAVNGRNLWIDIEARLPQSQIPVLIEVKTFEPSGSIVEYLGCAIGKYSLYRAVMERLGIDMPLYLAVPVEARYGIFEETVGQVVTESHGIRFIVFDPLGEEVVEWTPLNPS